MKHSYRFVIVAFSLMLLPFSSKAQIRYGLSAGVNLTDLYTKSSQFDNIDPSVNGQIGLLMQYNLLGNAFKGGFLKEAPKKKFWSGLSFGLALQSELLLNTKGGVIRDASYYYYNDIFDQYAPGATDLKLTSYNLELPLHLLAGVKYKKVTYFIQCSPFVSYLVKGQLNGQSDFFNAMDDRFSYNRFDWGFGYGLGIQTDKIQVNLKYEDGYMKTGKETIDETFSDDNYNPFYYMNNRCLSLSVGYFFNK